MNLAIAIKVAQFLRALSPLIPVIYDQMKELFANKPGMIKFEGFVEQVRGYVADVEELKPFAPVLEQAIPRLQTLVTKYHGIQTASMPAGAASATTMVHVSEQGTAAAGA